MLYLLDFKQTTTTVCLHLFLKIKQFDMTNIKKKTNQHSTLLMIHLKLQIV